MVPHAIFLCDFAHFVLIIKSTHDSRSSNRVDEKWMLALFDLLLHFVLECYWAHLSGPPIAWYLDHLLHSHACDHSSSVNTIVRLLSCKSNWEIICLPSLLPHMWEMLVSGREESHHVRHGTSWIESSIDVLLFEPESFSHHLNALNLHD